MCQTPAPPIGFRIYPKSSTDFTGEILPIPHRPEETGSGFLSPKQRLNPMEGKYRPAAQMIKWFFGFFFKNYFSKTKNSRLSFQIVCCFIFIFCIYKLYAITLPGIFFHTLPANSASLCISDVIPLLPVPCCACVLRF